MSKELMFPAANHEISYLTSKNKRKQINKLLSKTESAQVSSSSHQRHKMVRFYSLTTKTQHLVQASMFPKS